MYVKLSVDEYRSAMDNADKRYANCLENGFKGVNANPWGSDLRNHQLGCCSELAVSKALGLKWNNKLFSKEEYEDRSLLSRGNDVGTFEVRATENANADCLLLQKSDKINVFIFVKAFSPVDYTLVGWIDWTGPEDKNNQKWWNLKMPKPCYAIPSRDLLSMDLLLERYSLFPGIDHIEREKEINQ